MVGLSLERRIDDASQDSMPRLFWIRFQREGERQREFVRQTKNKSKMLVAESTASIREKLSSEHFFCLERPLSVLVITTWDVAKSAGRVVTILISIGLSVVSLPWPSHHKQQADGLQIPPRSSRVT